MAQLFKFEPLPKPDKLVCRECHASIDAPCNCGAGYVLEPGERAAAAVAASPEKSDRAIAAEIGVGHQTVARARRATGPDGPVDAPRTGLDGKTRKPRAKMESVVPQRTDIGFNSDAYYEMSIKAVLDTVRVWAKSMGKRRRAQFIAELKERIK
jgi:hypothetical protein